MKIGLVGCGNISDVYLQNLRRFEGLEVAVCADLDGARARSQAAKHGVPHACTTEALVTDPAVECVLDLTPPAAHFEIARRALEAGKHAYNEKPLAASRAEGRQLLDAARRRGLRIGCAPDTFLGAGLQTCRKALDAGLVGAPVAATAFMMYAGHEQWHPDPEFFYQPGAGPLFDMGPYYLTALVHLLGSVRRVCASAKTTYAERVIATGPKRGTRFPVGAPTHVAAVLDFDGGATAMLMMSFDGWYHELPVLEVYGTEGSMSVPDPNTFGGTVRVRRARTETWEPLPTAFGYAENSRGLGLADMAEAIRAGRPHRASGELAFHVLDVMEACYESSREGRHIEVSSRCGRPEPMREGLAFGEL